MQRPPHVYLDHNATTPCAPEVVEAMLPFLAGEFANPGSPHQMGRAAAAAVAAAREQVAALVGCDVGQITFTSGATESNNIALLGLAGASPSRRKIITSAVEHKSVLSPCDHLSERGFEVVRLPVDRDGMVELSAAESLIDDKTLLVSIQGANNEIGVIQPLDAIADLASAHGALMHSDGAQVLGKIPVAVDALEVHFASFSGHKLYGPKGIGALYVRDTRSRSLLTPLQFGGGQEDGLRPGTLNVAAIVGFGVACRVAGIKLLEEARRIGGLRDRLERGIVSALPGTTINGQSALRLPGTSSLTIQGVPADALISNATGVCFSDGSACSSGTPSPSHVLLAMGLSASAAEETVRTSVGRYTALSEVDLAVAILADAASRVRALL